MVRQVIFTLLLLASASNVQAQTPEAASNKDSLVKDVLRLSNSQRLFDEITSVYTDSLMQGLATVNPEIREDLRKVIVDNFKGHRKVRHLAERSNLRRRELQGIGYFGGDSQAASARITQIRKPVAIEPCDYRLSRVDPAGSHIAGFSHSPFDGD